MMTTNSSINPISRNLSSAVENTITLSQSELFGLVNKALQTTLGQLNLENPTPDIAGISEGENDMPKRIRERVQIGSYANGDPIYTWAEGKTHQELQLNTARLLIKYGLVNNSSDTESAPSPHTPFFETYAEQWWRLYKLPKLRQTTQTTYRNLLDNHILPYFKNKRLEEINTNIIQMFYNQHSDKSKSTVRQMSILLHQIFDMAVEDGHMNFNPTESKRLSMTERKKKREALNPSEIRSILENLHSLESSEKHLIALLLLTGMRRGEVLGLCWQHIDWQKKLIHVEQAVTFHNNQPVIGTTKSEAGIRVIPLDPRLEAILLPEKHETGFILDNGGTPLTERTFTRMWQRIGRKIDLFKATPHIFRHTYITMAASSGIDVKTLQSIAGHADIKMTMDRYAHKREEKVIQAGPQISQIWGTV